MPIKACQGCLKDRFLTTVDALDCFTGKQLWLWGSNGGGELGTNLSNVARSSPIQTISSGTNWKSVSPSRGVGFFSGGFGTTFTLGIKQDGTLWTWGVNCNGSLGTNTIVSHSSPVQTVSGGTNWKSVSAGIHAAAIKTDGTLWLWGSALFGNLGDNTNVFARSSPVQTISGGTNWKSVSVGFSTTAAIKTDGTLWTWGANGAGQLGTNDIITRSSPTQTVSGGTNWKEASMNSSVAAIKTDGTLWTWGSNCSGKIGNNTLVDVSSPVQTISGGTNWKSAAAGWFATGAIKTDGTLWMWGSGGFTGKNDIINRSSPVQTISGGTNWRAVDTGASNTLAVKTDGTLWAWGSNFSGMLATNRPYSENASSPVQTISGGTGWKSVASGIYMSAAVKEVEF